MSNKQEQVQPNLPIEINPIPSNPTPPLPNLNEGFEKGQRDGDLRMPIFETPPIPPVNPNIDKE